MSSPLLSVLQINLGTAMKRPTSSFVIILGIAGVVGVLTCVLAMGSGILQAIANNGRADRAIVLSTGASNESTSSIPHDTAMTILHAPGVSRTARDEPIASTEAVVQVRLPRKSNGKNLGVTLRGVGDAYPQLHPESHIIAGRTFRPGTRELIAGDKVAAAFAGVEVGKELRFQNSTWTVVGIFKSEPASARDSELLTNAQTVMSAYARSAFQSVTVRLGAEQAFDTFQEALDSDPSVHASVQRESEFFAAQSRPMARALNAIAYFIGGVMAIGAIFGALNTMYSAVSTRSRQIATLRALGFGQATVIVSVIGETLVLALAGALLGSLVAWLLFNGNVVSLQSFGGVGSSQLAFSMSITPTLLITGALWACIIGLIGGLFPALRAATIPVASMLRRS
jgi:putative ABC transport system permease protein